jgi:hypothetical protein
MFMAILRVAQTIFVCLKPPLCRHLAVEGRVAASTQNQAKSALLFPYREVLVLEQELPWLNTWSAQSSRDA